MPRRIGLSAPWSFPTSVCSDPVTSAIRHVARSERLGREAIVVALAPYPAEEMKVCQVSTVVNNPANEISARIAPFILGGERNPPHDHFSS
jgi:hypothetical protein